MMIDEHKPGTCWAFLIENLMKNFKLYIPFEFDHGEMNDDDQPIVSIEMAKEQIRNELERIVLGQTPVLIKEQRPVKVLVKVVDGIIVSVSSDTELSVEVLDDDKILEETNPSIKMGSIEYFILDDEKSVIDINVPEIFHVIQMMRKIDKSE